MDRLMERVYSDALLAAWATVADAKSRIPGFQEDPHLSSGGGRFL